MQTQTATTNNSAPQMNTTASYPQVAQVAQSVSSSRPSMVSVKLSVDTAVQEKRVNMLSYYRSKDFYADMSPVKLVVSAITGVWEPTLIMKWAEVIADVTAPQLVEAMLHKLTEGNDVFYAGKDLLSDALITTGMSKRDYDSVLRFLSGLGIPIALEARVTTAGYHIDNATECFPLGNLSNWKTLSQLANEAGGMGEVKKAAYDRNAENKARWEANKAKWAQTVKVAA